MSAPVIITIVYFFLCLASNRLSIAWLAARDENNAIKAANICTQAMGGMGLLKPYGLDRLSRLAQMLRIVDGTTEVSRVVIGRALKKRATTLPAVPVPKGYGQV